MWFNSLLSHIRQNIYDLQRSLLSGPNAFPWKLKKTADSLMQGQVPITWVHPNNQPTTHSLASWQIDVSQRYDQMSGWLKQQMVPVFLGDDNIPIAHGQLKRVWLGGLVNPQALFTAILHEAALGCDCLDDQMAVSCEMLEPGDSHDDQGGIVFYGAHLQGAEWDSSQQCLTASRQDVNPMPNIFVRPVCVVEDVTSAPNKFLCPVFMNMARQVCAFHLPLTTGDTATDAWTLAGTAVILDRGLCVDTLKKPRAVDVSEVGDSQDTLAASQRPPTLRPGIESHQSTPSQLSNKPLSPQAPALPPDLQQQMQRGKPLGDPPVTDKSPQPADDTTGPSRAGSVTSARSTKSPTVTSARKTSVAGSEASHSEQGAAPGTADMSKVEAPQEQRESAGSTHSHSQGGVDESKDDAGEEAQEQEQVSSRGESRQSTVSKGSHVDRQQSEPELEPELEPEQEAASGQKTSDRSEPAADTASSMHSNGDAKHDSNSPQKSSDNGDTPSDDPTDDADKNAQTDDEGDDDTSGDDDTTTQRPDKTKDTVE
ncbi:hypothetical protein NP493_68g03006 [Ridgeia piscesae]|uniref:Dynein heavy chain C-terminal domain-containing protein n=1 Tax=Ridgeia piscesae TaxID=27915 RepID=A0AAD9P9V6_RIDPI|nr:hypothetical protein NP493_68g03006 [Ridgeia piscesae]